MKFNALLLAFALSASADHAVGQTGTVISTSFEEGLVFLDLPAPDHSTLHILSDSGGGAPTLSSEAASRLRLMMRSIDDENLLIAYGPSVRVANATELMARRWPALRFDASFVVVPGVMAFQGEPPIADGMLGSAWFGRHTWTWDYPHGRLILRPTRWRAGASARELTMTFKMPEHGLTWHYARMMMRVDDIDLPMLFDTGAHTVLTPTALQELNDGKPASRAASLITHSIFEAWRVRHPDWRLIDDAQLATHSRMILVPNVQVAGCNAGPVWFTERQDEAFHDTWAAVMSARIEGALGGNAFARFVISVDYPRSRAWVSQTKAARH